MASLNAFFFARYTVPVKTPIAQRYVCMVYFMNEGLNALSGLRAYFRFLCTWHFCQVMVFGLAVFVKAASLDVRSFGPNRAVSWRYLLLCACNNDEFAVWFLECWRTAPAFICSRRACHNVSTNTCGTGPTRLRTADGGVLEFLPALESAQV